MLVYRQEKQERQVAYINHEHLKTLVCVADNQNISKAAEKLNLSQPTVSKHIQTLEAVVGAKLIATSPRGATLTEEGEKFIEFARSALQMYDSVKREIKDNKNSLEGELTVISSRFGINTLAKHFEYFMSCYPQIELHINYDDYPKLIRGADIPGTYVGLTDKAPLKTTPLVWKQFVSFSFYPYVHADYVEKYGMPKNKSDLDGHKIIGYKWTEPYDFLEYEQSNTLLFLNRDGDNLRKPIVTVDDIETCRLLVERGIGIGMLPPFLTQGRNFIPVFLNEYDPCLGLSFEMNYVYKTNLKTNARVLAFVEFIKEVSSKEARITLNTWKNK